MASGAQNGKLCPSEGLGLRVVSVSAASQVFVTMARARDLASVLRLTKPVTDRISSPAFVRRTQGWSQAWNLG